MVMPQGEPIIAFPSQAAWEVWLEEHHSVAPGIWLQIARKDAGIETVSHQEALDVALCYGWIDAQRRKGEGGYFLQRFTPRRAKSKWSQVNREKVTRLIAESRMKAAGLREIEKAKADGRWDAAYAPQSSIAVPDDLQRELDRNDRAREFFAALDSRNRYAILYRIQDARRPETRAARIAKFVAMLNEGKKIYP
jgi:uncharacterized protein YdeI (YjbR/CyaY-like superfamily)